MAGVIRPRLNEQRRIINISIGGMIALSGILMAILISFGDVGIGGLVVLTPVVIGILGLILVNPYYGLMFYLNYSFFFIGLSRYVPNVPLSLTVDFVLLVTTLSMVVRIRVNNVGKLNTGVFYLAVFWFIYTLLEILNSEATQALSWFFAVRCLSVYAVQTIPLTLILFDKKENVHRFVRVILGWGFISALWG